jgi:hypothetical protein
MWTKRAGDLVAAFVVGNGVLDLLAPRQRVLLWVLGPAALRKLALWLADHPTAMRLRGAVRIGTGVWLALRQSPASSPAFLLAPTLVLPIPLGGTPLGGITAGPLRIGGGHPFDHGPLQAQQGRRSARQGAV